MGYILGGLIGAWLLYAILELIFKHKIGLIVMTCLGVLAGISSIVSSGSPYTLIAAILGCILIALIVPLQVKSDAKEAWKNRKSNDED